VLPFHLQALLGIGPARVGLIFGIAALTGATMHPVFGRLADRWGAARMMRYGLFCTAGSLALLGQTWSVQSAIGLYVLFAGTVAMVVTPSLAYMAEAALDAGIGSFGAVYGLYNVAWGVGLLGGPALSGYLYERIGFGRLTLAWAPFLVGISWWLGRVQSVRSPSKELI
jgi:MFS family permease